MPQARVFANGPVRRWAAAQGDGTFRFDRLPVGKYNLQARARGYEAQWSSPAVDVSEDQTSEGIRFALSPRPPAAITTPMVCWGAVMHPIVECGETDHDEVGNR